MSNANYYRYEAALIKTIQAADPEALRGALAGAVRWCSDANFNRTLHQLLQSNSDPQSELRKTLTELDAA